MAKAPKDIPTEAGQRVKRRGRDDLGLVTRIDGTWVWVQWELNREPKICHAWELVVPNAE